MKGPKENKQFRSSISNVISSVKPPTPFTVVNKQGRTGGRERVLKEKRKRRKKEEGRRKKEEGGGLLPM
jgi:hypothetical protein